MLTVTRARALISVLLPAAMLVVVVALNYAGSDPHPAGPAHARGVLTLPAAVGPMETASPYDDHAHDHARRLASAAPGATSICDKDIDTSGEIAGVTFVAAQENGICTNGDIDTYVLGGQHYVVQAGGQEAAFTISRIAADGTPTLVVQRFWSQPNTNTADVMPFKKNGRQYLSLALERTASLNSSCGVAIVDVTDAPDVTDADTVALVTGGAEWCNVHNNFVESIAGEGRYIYLTANQPHDMRVLDIANLAAIAEVGRYTHPAASSSNFVHDVTVIDHGGSIGRRAYVAYWSAGLMILDANDVTPGVVDAASANQPLNPDYSIDPGILVHHAFPDATGRFVFIQDEFINAATNQSLDGDEPIQMWNIVNPAAPVFVDGIDLGSPLMPLVNPPHNMEIRYDVDLNGDSVPDRDRLYVGWYRGGLQAFDFTLGGFTARPLHHQVQTEAEDLAWDGAWAVRLDQIGGQTYFFQSDRRYGLIVDRLGEGPPPPTPTSGPSPTPTPIPDSDGDGYDDAADNCPGVWNSAQTDTDADALGDTCEPAYGTLASVRDTDDDGCADGREVRTLAFLPAKGGSRDPLSYWDFFDVPAPALTAANPGGTRSGAITLGDVLSVLYYSGASDNGPPIPAGVDYDTDLNTNGIEDGAEYDRTPGGGATPWRAGPPSGAISIIDVLVALAQVGHDCIPPP